MYQPIEDQDVHLRDLTRPKSVAYSEYHGSIHTATEYPSSIANLVPEPSIHMGLEGNDATNDNNEYDNKPASWQFKYHMITLGLVWTLTLAILAAWLAIQVRQKDGSLSMASSPIGGRFTQTQAKWIDILASVLVAPLILLALNWCWFSSARVTVFNERDPSTVSLNTLAQVSHTDAGSYDMFKLWDVVRSGRPNMFLFAALMLLAAVTRTAFANAVAYEAFDMSVEDVSPYLPTLLFATEDSESLMFPSPWTEPYQYWNPVTNVYHDFNAEQTAVFAEKFLSTMTRIALDADFPSRLQQTYIGINLTQASMKLIAPDIIDLYNVPAYRLAIDCSPVKVHNLSVIQVGIISPQTDVTWITNAVDEVLTAATPGLVEDLDTEYKTPHYYIGFSRSGDSALLGATIPAMIGDETPTSTPFGDMHKFPFDLSYYGIIGMDSQVLAWGLRCNMTREAGSHNLSRGDDLVWSISQSSWSGLKKRTRIHMGDWQLEPPFRMPIETRTPGIGPVFYREDAYEWALRFLYGAGEIDQLLHETINMGKKPQDEGGPGYVQVKAKRKQQYYRITYVPALLFLGLLCAWLAGAITMYLAIRSRKAASLKSWRELNTIRLIIDAVDELKEFPSIQGDKRDASNEELEKLARRIRVKYFRDKE